MFTSAPVPFVHATFAHATFVHSTSVRATFVTATFVQGHLVVYNCSLSRGIEYCQNPTPTQLNSTQLKATLLNLG